MNSTRTPWTVTALMGLGTFLAMLALTTLIDGAGWLRTVLFVLVVVCGVDLAVRAASRSRFLPSAAAIGAAIIVMVPLFALKEDGGKHLLPTPAALGALWDTLVAGAEYAARTPAPANPTVELTALVVAFAVAVFVAADHLAASWKAVAVSGIVLILPWTPAIFLQYQVPMWALFATAACWMLAMGAVRSSHTSARSVPLTGAVIASTAALLVAVLVAPAAVGGNGWGAIPRFNAPSALDTSTRLNLALDLRNSLTVNSAKVVFTYVSTGRHPDALRLYTLRDFDGTTWTREKDEADDLVPVGSDVLWPEPVLGWDDEERVILSFDLTGASERNLPIPVVPRSVDVEDGWQYTASRDEVTQEDGNTNGLKYSIVAALDYFTAEKLLDTQGTIDAGTEPVSSVYTEMPTSVDIGRISTLTDQVTSEANAATQYDEAVAIQDYLRDSSNFTYDTSVNPARGGDAVSQFLDDRVGYCVQFATTMVMMARSAGIPARLAMGYLGGQLGDNGTWQVLGGDAHVWPELYFPGEGWVRFEPTPAVQTGSAPNYTVEQGSGLNPNVPTNIPIPTTVPSTNPTIPSPGATSQTGGDADAGVSVWAIVGLVLVVLAAVAVGWVLRRRSAAHSHAHGPEAAWEALRDRLPDQLRWAPSSTPIEAASRLEHELDLALAPLDADGASALRNLRDAVSDSRYAPPVEDGAEPSQEWLMEQVNVVATQANEALRSRSDRAGAQSALRRDS
ncbi:transglutaminaseTgpA domain-containing protein [Demequina sp.]|uniref:transglutaminase family protein n=1 Tax=Demequina sp. TaxID=2050685 RepID=UPI003D0C2E02